MQRRKILQSLVAAVAATFTSSKIWGASASTNASVHHAIKINQFTFSPPTLSVRAGDRVTWINLDIVPHTASAFDGSWDSGQLGPNDSGEIVVSENLAESYLCRFHPSMIGELKLSPPG